MLSLIVNQQGLSSIPFPYVGISGVSRTRTINSFVNRYFWEPDAKLLVLHRSLTSSKDVWSMLSISAWRQVTAAVQHHSARTSGDVSRFLVNWDAAVWKWAFYHTHTNTLALDSFVTPCRMTSPHPGRRAPVKSCKFRSFVDVKPNFVATRRLRVSLKARCELGARHQAYTLTLALLSGRPWPLYPSTLEPG